MTNETGIQGIRNAREDQTGAKGIRKEAEKTNG